MDGTAYSAPAPGSQARADAEIAEIVACFDDLTTLPQARTLASLEPLAQWVGWRYETRKGQSKRTKVPYRPDGRKAKSNDPSTWRTRRAVYNYAGQPVYFAGAGLMLGELRDGSGLGVYGIDLDTCRDPKSGEIAAWAAEELARFPTYAEVSPSGTGVKLFGLYRMEALSALLGALGQTYGKQRYGFKRCLDGGEHGPAIEFYAAVRFFTVTGERLPDAPVDLHLTDAAPLLHLIREHGGGSGGRHGPHRASTGGAGAGRDKSRSAAAMRRGKTLVQMGATYEEMRDGLLDDSGEVGEWAHEKGLANGERELWRIYEKTRPEARDGTAEDLAACAHLSERAIACAFAEKHRGRLRYCHTTGAWSEWTGTAWRREGTQRAFHWAGSACHDYALGAKAGVGLVRLMGRAATAAGVERHAKAHPDLGVTAEAWDSDPWLLGTPGGTVELRTGALRPARPEDGITKLTAVAPIPLEAFDPARDCPVWLAFLDDTFGGDAELVRFVQRWLGYNLTGDTREHALVFGSGVGRNGKGTLFNTFGDLLGDYCVNVEMETLSANKYDRHATELARLRGARMARTSETQEGKGWNEARIKMMTGGDKITANFMRQDKFEFQPEFKLTVFGNHKPTLRQVDEAIRARMNVVPFARVVPPERQDKELGAKLRAEGPGILAWAVRGCLDWQENGLVRPRAVAGATAEYLGQQDTLQQWVEDCCEVGGGHVCTFTALWDSWSAYAEAHGEGWALGGSKDFSEKLQARGFERIKDIAGIRGRGFRGLRLRPADDVVEGMPECDSCDE